MQTEIALFTIDAEHSRDLDDAIGIASNESGWTVRVAIANPSAHVPIGSAEDLAARKQGATIYRGRRATMPMLPLWIAEERATLTAGVPRSAVLIDLELDQAGQHVGTRASLGEITVVQRLSYKDVPSIASVHANPLHLAMVDAIAISRGFLKQRRARGALAFLDHQQMLLTDEVEETPGWTGPSFKAISTMRDVERGVTYRAVATDGKKKAAEQAAALLALCDLMGVARPRPSCAEDEAPSSSPAAPAAAPAQQPAAAVHAPQIANPKGALLELCQKQKLGTPTFTSTSTGPSNSPAFVCTAELLVSEETLSARSVPTPAKRQAEALAAEALLEQLVARQARSDHVENSVQGPAAAQNSASTSTSVPAVSDRGRSIQLLQEYAQKARLPLPVYEFAEISQTPSSFECTVRLDLTDGSFQARATASSKQASKGAAAALAFDQLASAVAA